MSEKVYRRVRGGGNKKAPWIVRWIAWTALILVFLAFGFYGSGALFRSLDKKGMLPVEGVISKADDLPKVLNVSDSDHLTVGKNLDLKIYTLYQGNLGQGQLRIISNFLESDIKKALTALFASSDEPTLKQIVPAHVFRDGVTLNIDMPGVFVNALADLSPEASAAVREAIGRTVVENFPPITRVAFLTDGRWASDVNNVELSKPWEAPAK